MYKIVVWGIGTIYNKHVNLLKYYESKREIEVIALTSSNPPKVRSIDGYKVIDSKEITSLVFDFILIMNDASAMEIREVITCMGVDAGKLLHYKIMEIPNLIFDEYVKLKRSRISIISNNCWGGIVYNTLGMECLSPFKNLFLDDESYLRMLGNLDYYLGCEPDDGGLATDIHSGKVYPVLKLDDVLVHCNHDDIYETAVENWKRRIKKINKDNLFIEMYTDSRLNAKRFCQIKNYSNKVCFVSFQSNEKELYYLELLPGQKEL